MNYDWTLKTLLVLKIEPNQIFPSSLTKNKNDSKITRMHHLQNWLEGSGALFTGSSKVIIPVFNDQSRLNRLLALLSEQTLPPSLFSVTVVDNGSDSPVVLPEGLPFHCRLMLCSKHGSYAARNVAWPNTQAPWVAFTDSDCLPDTDSTCDMISLGTISLTCPCNNNLMHGTSSPLWTITSPFL